MPGSNSVPEITDAQRAEALDRSREARRYRAAAKIRLKSGSLTMQEALADRRLARMRAGELIKSMPGVGRKSALPAAQALCVDPSRRLSQLGCRQRERLVSWAAAGCPAPSAKAGE